MGMGMWMGIGMGMGMRSVANVESVTPFCKNGQASRDRSMDEAKFRLDGCYRQGGGHWLVSSQAMMTGHDEDAEE